MRSGQRVIGTVTHAAYPTTMLVLNINVLYMILCSMLCYKYRACRLGSHRYPRYQSSVRLLHIFTRRELYVSSRGMTQSPINASGSMSTRLSYSSFVISISRTIFEVVLKQGFVLEIDIAPLGCCRFRFCNRLLGLKTFKSVSLFFTFALSRSLPNSMR